MRLLPKVLSVTYALTLIACTTRGLEPAEAVDDASVHKRCYTNINGAGTPPDFAVAHTWCKAGALRGIAGSQVLYAQLHWNGEGVKKDPATALYWYSKAAAQGHHHALLMLYRMHALGETAPKDHVKALAYLQRSAAAGNVIAAEELERIEVMPQTERRRADALRGDPEAQAALGFYHSWGPLTVRDYPQAVAWFEKSGAAGSAVAKNNLAELYETGEGVVRDYPKAIRLYREAASTGLVPALYALARMYESGNGLGQSMAMAYLFFRMAALAKPGSHTEVNARQNYVRLALTLPAAQVATLDQAAHAWKPGQPLPASVPST
jgi:TPR repeat protein